MTEITIAGEAFNVRLEGDGDKPFLALAHQLGATLVLTAALVARHVLGGTRKTPPAGL